MTTHNPEAVEIVARALLREFNDTVEYADLQAEWKREFSARATALLTSIGYTGRALDAACWAADRLEAQAQAYDRLGKLGTKVAAPPDKTSYAAAALRMAAKDLRDHVAALPAALWPSKVGSLDAAAVADRIDDRLAGAFKKAEALMHVLDLKGANKTTLQRLLDVCADARAEIARLSAPSHSPAVIALVRALRAVMATYIVAGATDAQNEPAVEQMARDALVGFEGVGE